MAKCLKCGKTYLTKECISCRDSSYKYNKKDIKNENRYLWKILSLILVASSAVAITLLVIELKDQKAINDYYKNQTETIKIKNEQLIRKNSMNERLINSMKKQIRELVHKSRNRSNTYSSNTINIQPKRIQNKVRNKNSNTYQKKQVRKKQAVTNKYKTYNKYSGYEKIVSDSNIKKRSDNRLISNSPIYGIYKYPLLNKISCGKYPKIYKIRNQCSSIATYTSDRLYFSKSNIKELKDFNKDTHKIECKYSQEHGVMHDCRTKIFKYKYR